MMDSSVIDLLLSFRGCSQRIKSTSHQGRVNQNKMFEWIRNLDENELEQLLVFPADRFSNNMQSMLNELEVIHRAARPRNIMFRQAKDGLVLSESSEYPMEFYPIKIFEKEVMHNIAFSMKSSSNNGGYLILSSLLSRGRNRFITLLSELSLQCAFSQPPEQDTINWFSTLPYFTMGQYIINLIETRLWEYWRHQQEPCSEYKHVITSREFLKLHLVCRSSDFHSILAQSAHSVLQELLHSSDESKQLLIAQTSRTRQFPLDTSLLRRSTAVTKLWFLNYMSENSSQPIIKEDSKNSHFSRLLSLLCLPLPQVMTPWHEYRALLLTRMEAVGARMLQDELIAEDFTPVGVARAVASIPKKRKPKKKVKNKDKVATSSSIVGNSASSESTSLSVLNDSTFMCASDLSADHLQVSARNIFIGQIVEGILDLTFQTIERQVQVDDEVSESVDTCTDAIIPFDAADETAVEVLGQEKSNLPSSGYDSFVYPVEVPWYLVRPPSIPVTDTLQSSLPFQFDPIQFHQIPPFSQPFQPYDHFQQYSGQFPGIFPSPALGEAADDSVWGLDLRQLIEDDDAETQTNVTNRSSVVSLDASEESDIHTSQKEQTTQIPSKLSSPKSSLRDNASRMSMSPMTSLEQSSHPNATSDAQLADLKRSIRDLLLHSTLGDSTRACLVNQMSVYRGLFVNFTTTTTVQVMTPMSFQQQEDVSQYRSRAKSYQIDAAAASQVASAARAVHYTKQSRSGSVSELPADSLSRQQGLHRAEAMSEAGDVSRDERDGPHLTRSQSIGQHLSVKALLPLQPLVATRTPTRPAIKSAGPSDAKRRNSVSVVTKDPAVQAKPLPSSINDTCTAPSDKPVPLTRLLDRQVSQLTLEILAFTDKMESMGRSIRRLKLQVVDRLRATVKGLWPRAQVKIFGSFVSGLSLPTSDLDMVICLPKVHLEAGPAAPGVLEGRNAIKESWQQNLSRCLSGESWVVADSIKVIGNTAIPVLKVKTRPECFEGAPIALDISFEGPGHRGLEANQMIVSLLSKHVNLRPLVLVLKCFLSRKSLSEAFTGGLSSYSLLLMIVRFLQEVESTGMHPHESRVDDLGALLLGFLRFFGEQFDVRQTGISVRRKCYFSRRDNQVHLFQQQQQQQIHQQASFHAPGPDMIDRRHSLQGMRNGVAGAPVYFPFKFDPVFIEDPLEERNNVARNCFRILQVQRCWTDAASSIVNRLREAETSSAEGDGHLRVLEALIGSEAH